MNQVGDILNKYIKKYINIPNIVVGSIAIMGFFYVMFILFSMFSVIFNIRYIFHIEFVPMLQKFGVTFLWLFEIISILWLFKNYKNILSIKFDYKIIASLISVLLFTFYKIEFIRNDIADGFLYINKIFNYTNTQTLSDVSNFMHEKSSTINLLKEAEPNKYYVTMSYFMKWYGIKWFFEQRLFMHIVIGFINTISYIFVIDIFIKKYKLNNKIIFAFILLPLIFASWDIAKIIYLPMFISYYNTYIIIPVLYLIIENKKFFKSIIIIMITIIIYGWTHKILEINAVLLIFYKLYKMFRESLLYFFKNINYWLFPLMFLLFIILENFVYITPKYNNLRIFNFCKEKMDADFTDVICSANVVKELFQFLYLNSWTIKFIPFIIYYFTLKKIKSNEINFMLTLLSILIFTFTFQRVSFLIESTLFGYVVMRIISMLIYILLMILINKLFITKNTKIMIITSAMLLTTLPISKGFEKISSIINAPISNNIFSTFDSNGLYEEHGIEKYIRNNNLRYNSVFIDGPKENNEYQNSRQLISETYHSTYAFDLVRLLKLKLVIPKKYIFIEKNYIKDNLIKELEKLNYLNTKKTIKIRSFFNNKYVKYIKFERS